MQKISAQLTKILKNHHSGKKKDVSEETGISISTLSKAINNSKANTVFTPENALRLAQTYGITLDYIYGASDVERISEIVAFEILKMVSPVRFVWESKGDTYSIKTVTVSNTLMDYFRTIWVAEESHLGEASKENLRRVAQKEFIAALENDVEAESTEYALISIEKLKNAHLLTDLEIYPDTK